jgi:hypothetical protein
VRNILPTRGRAMHAVRRLANRMARRLDRALCIVADLPIAWFPTIDEIGHSPWAVIARDFESDETEAFATRSVVAESGAISLSPHGTEVPFSRWQTNIIGRSVACAHFVQRGRAITCGGRSRVEYF